MKFNHSKLLGRIKERGYTQQTLAEAINLTKSSLNSKLKNMFYFTSRDIYAICEVLDIPTSEIGVYFFMV